MHAKFLASTSLAALIIAGSPPAAAQNVSALNCADAAPGSYADAIVDGSSCGFTIAGDLEIKLSSAQLRSDQANTGTNSSQPRRRR